MKSLETNDSLNVIWNESKHAVTPSRTGEFFYLSRLTTVDVAALGTGMLFNNRCSLRTFCGLVNISQFTENNSKSKDTEFVAESGIPSVKVFPRLSTQNLKCSQRFPT